MSRRSLSLKRLLPFLILCLWLPQLFAASYLHKRVVVHLKGGSKITGIVVDEKVDGSMQLQVSHGRVWLKPSRIVRIVAQKPPEEEFAERAAKCKTAADWVELARWCGLGDVRLPEKRRRCLDEALALDPDHEGANLELGNVKVRGRWYPEEEGNKLLGKVKVDGEWYTPEEAERVKRRKELRKNNKYLRGLLRQEEERLGIPWTTAKTVETDYYKVKCNSTEDVAKRYADVMDALYRAYNEIFPESKFPRYTQEKGIIYIFRNNTEFNDFTLMGQGIGGFFSFSDRAVRAYHGSFGITGSTDMVLAHEATHQFQYRIMNDMRTVPTWLIEGMAVYYGDGTEISRDKVELHKIPRDRLHTLQQAIETGRYTELRKLIRIPQRAFGGQFYDHAWGVIYWCLQGEKYGAHSGEGRRVWDTYLAHVCKESPKLTEVLQSYPEHMEKEAKLFEDLILKETGAASIEEWEEGYKKFISELKLDPLGEWKGLKWDGSEMVGISLRFPKGLRPVEEKNLRQQFREAAAAETREADVRMWVTVDYNWVRQASPDEKLLKAYLNGFFRPVGTDEEMEFRSVKHHGIGMTIASFKGRLARRQEQSTFNVNTARGEEGEEKKSAGEEETKSAGAAIDPNSLLRVRVALITTPDKLYLVALAGLEAPFSKIDALFEDALESVRLTFN